MSDSIKMVVKAWKDTVQGMWYFTLEEYYLYKYINASDKHNYRKAQRYFEKSEVATKKKLHKMFPNFY